MNPNMCFRCRSEDQYIVDCTKPDNSENKVRGNTDKPKTCSYK